jgi:hypothetical protein
MNYWFVLIIIVLIIIVVAENEKQACKYLGDVGKIINPTATVIKYMAKMSRKFVFDGDFP